MRVADRVQDGKMRPYSKRKLAIKLEETFRRAWAVSIVLASTLRAVTLTLIMVVTVLWRRILDLEPWRCQTSSRWCDKN